MSRLKSAFTQDDQARQNGNKGQITIIIQGLGSRTPNPPIAPMPGIFFAQRPQMRSSQETRFLLPVAALSVETRGNKRAKQATSQVKAGARFSAKKKTDNNKKKPLSYKSEANHQEKVTRETKEKTKETREKKLKEHFVKSRANFKKRLRSQEKLKENL